MLSIYDKEAHKDQFPMPPHLLVRHTNGVRKWYKTFCEKLLLQRAWKHCEDQVSGAMIVSEKVIG